MKWCCGGASSANENAVTSSAGDDDDKMKERSTKTFSSRKFPMINGGNRKDVASLRHHCTADGQKIDHVNFPLEVLGNDAKAGKSPKLKRHVSKTVQYADEILPDNRAAGDVNDASTSQSPPCDQPPGDHTINATPTLDNYGPMVLRVPKTVIIATRHARIEETNTLINRSPFLCKLRNNGWTLTNSTVDSIIEDICYHHPVLILIDQKIINHVPALMRKIRGSNSVSVDVLIGLVVEKVPILDRNFKSIAEFHLQFFLHSSVNIALCEQFAKIAGRLRAVPALFAVVEEAQQPIKICDEQNFVQYVNRAYELCTGDSRSVVLGSHNQDGVQWNRLISSASPPDVSMTGSLAGSLPLPVSVAVEPCSESGSGTRRESIATSAEIQHPSTSIIQRRRSTTEWHCITVPGTIESQQFVYVKRGSTDASIYQRDSIKGSRSQSHGILAPITEALSSLASIVHKCDEDTQNQLRDVIRILSSAELYTPKAMRFGNGDRVGYYDGLIRIHHPSRQRKRSVVDSFRDHQRRMSTSSGTIAIPPDYRRVSAEIANVLDNEPSWEFNIIELERITDHHPLSRLGAKIFDRWNVNETLNCSPETINKWLLVVEANYQAGNAYHNATHAADVLQATSYFLGSEQVGQYVQDQHAMCALIAATIHDLDHPGRGNAFLVNTAQKLAVLYNDASVLENHHVALAFQLTLGQQGVNIFARVPREEFSHLRKAIIDMVLATDMSRHFEHLTRFQQLMNLLPDNDESREDHSSSSMVICKMMIKCADIANTTREWSLCREWAMRICEEYFEQTSEEIERNLPVTMKGFERLTCNIPLTQCTFMDIIARETFTDWCNFAGLNANLLNLLETNYENWRAESANWDPKIMNVYSHNR